MDKFNINADKTEIREQAPEKRQKELLGKMPIKKGCRFGKPTCGLVM